MTSTASPLSFPLGGDDSLQTRLQYPFANAALEALRVKFIDTVVSSHYADEGAAVVIQMVFDTDVGTLLKRFVYTPYLLTPKTVFEPVESRRSYRDVDTEMRRNKYLIKPAVEALVNSYSLNQAYADYLNTYLLSEYPRYRMSGVSGILCLGKLL